jgi:hypothetical protein
VVFTLPPAAAEITFQNKAAVYAILMRTATEALMTLATDPKHLGAEIGLLAVLHTWGQTLTITRMSIAWCRAATNVSATGGRFSSSLQCAGLSQE